MKTKWLIFVLLLSLAINLAAISTIFYHRFNRPHFPPFPEEDGALAEPLDPRLRPSPEQIELMKGCRMRFHHEIQPIHTEIQSDRRRLLELLVQPRIDTLRIFALQDSISDLQQHMQQEVVRHIIEQRQFLNENQYRVIFHRIGKRLLNPDDEFPPAGPGRRGFRNRKIFNE